MKYIDILKKTPVVSLKDMIFFVLLLIGFAMH